MSIVGVICPRDDSYQSFQHCIDCHENRTASCNAPVFVLKMMRDNHLTRTDAGVSVSTLTSCPREVAIMDKYPVYESVISGYNKGRGTAIHDTVEKYDTDPPEWIIRERRLYINLLGKRVSGKPDEVDTRFHVLVDFKSKHNLPLKRDPTHEFQFNGYAYMLAKGRWADTDEPADIRIDRIGGHYITWDTKTERAWRKDVYPVWDLDVTEGVLTERLQNLIPWYDYKVMPKCSPYQTFPGRWRCHCAKLQDQLEERGIWDD